MCTCMCVSRPPEGTYVHVYTHVWIPARPAPPTPRDALPFDVASNPHLTHPP